MFCKINWMFYVANIGIYRRNYLVEDYKYEDEFKELYSNIENDEVKKNIILEQTKFKNADHNKKENDSKPTNNSKLNDKNEELKSPTGCMNTRNKT